MQTKLSNCLLIILCLLVHFANAQQLKPGFDKGEYINLMKVSAQVGDSAYIAATPAPQGFRQLYRSPALGLDNLWDLWMTTEQVPVISTYGRMLGADLAVFHTTAGGLEGDSVAERLGHELGA